MIGPCKKVSVLKVVGALVLLQLCWMAYRVSLPTDEWTWPYLDAEIDAVKDPYVLAKELFRKWKLDTSPTFVDQYNISASLFTVPGTSTPVTDLEELRLYSNDPRLVWSVYLDGIVHGNSSALPFSWYDWADYYSYNKLLALKDTKLTCHFLLESAFDIEKLNQVERELGQELFSEDRVKYNEPNWYSRERKQTEKSVFDNLGEYCQATKDGHLPFNIIKLMDKTRPEVYQLQARNYILNNQPTPASITLLEMDINSYQLELDPAKRQNIVQSNLLHDFMQRNNISLNKPDAPQNILNHTFFLQEFLNSTKSNRLVIEGANYDAFNQDLIHLTKKDFDFNPLEKIDELKSKYDHLSIHEKNYLHSLENSIMIHPGLAPKYFHEAGSIKSFQGRGWHRDKRFFNGALLQDPQEYILRLNSLIRVFQKFTKANGLISWLAHGTYYGYLYNGLSFPWDSDFDLQMPIKHLNLLAQHFNQSLIMEDTREGNGRYFLDVGDSITVRNNGNGKNNIDARFIDVDSGLYIDITGMASTSDPIKKYLKDHFDKHVGDIRFNDTELLEKYPADRYIPTDAAKDSLVAMNIDQLYEYAESHKDTYDEETRKKLKEMRKNEAELHNNDSPENNLTPHERFIVNNELAIFNCRNNHFATLEMISPLRNTLFHGVPTFVPRSPIRMLNHEYKVPPKYGFLSFEGKVYLPEFRFWLVFDIIKKIANTNSWYSNFDKLETPLNKLSLKDVQQIYLNMVKGGYTELFGILYTTFNSTSYRVKELEIQYDSKIKIDDKVSILHGLRTKIAPNVTSPGKDPYLYSYERRLWDLYTSNMTNQTVAQIHDQVYEEAVEEVCTWTRNLRSRNFPLFKTENTTSSINEDGDIVNFNHYGMNLYGNVDLPLYNIFSNDTILEQDDVGFQ